MPHCHGDVAPWRLIRVAQRTWQIAQGCAVTYKFLEPEFPLASVSSIHGVQQMLDRFGISGIRRPSRCLEILSHSLGPFLNMSVSVAACIVLSRGHCHQGVLLPWGCVLALHWCFGWWHISRGIQVNARMEGFPANIAFLTGWSVTGFNFVTPRDKIKEKHKI